VPLRSGPPGSGSWQTAAGGTTALPALRLGEIEFLMHQYNDAAAEFGLAVRRWRLLDLHDDLDTWRTELDRGAALLAAGRTSEATQLVRPLDLLATQGYAYQNSLPNRQGASAALQFAAVSCYACEQLADYERESGNVRAAVEDYATALDWTPQIRQGSGVRPEVADNNAALGLGLAMGTIGLPWAPLPVVRADGEDDPRLHLAAPLTVAALSLPLFAESAWLHTSLTQGMGRGRPDHVGFDVAAHRAARRRPRRQGRHRGRSGRRGGRPACGPGAHLATARTTGQPRCGS
jgi:hypothetical protein